MAKKISPQRRLIDAAFDQTASISWTDMTMATIAGQAGVSLADALALFPNKNAILDAVIAETSVRALRECASFSDGDAVRDRLFALLMAHLDAMAPYRIGVGGIIRSLACDPFALLCRLPSAMAAMAAMLESAGVDSSGLGGAVRTNGLAIIFAHTVRVWLYDETEDKGPTMASLDRDLRRADMLVRQFGGAQSPENPEESKAPA